LPERGDSQGEAQSLAENIWCIEGGPDEKFVAAVTGAGHRLESASPIS